MVTTREQSTIARWRTKDQALVGLEGDDVRHLVGEGANLWMCGDLLRAHETVLHLGHTLTERIHLHCQNGGALVLDDAGPVNAGQSYWPFGRQQIAKTIRAKGLSVVLLDAHWPCTEAGAHGMALEAVMASLLAARAAVQREFPQQTAIPLFTVRRDERWYTYRVRERAMEEALPHTLVRS